MILTIITVTLNDLLNLKRTYESLKTQNDFEFCWLVKDGGSTDGTLAFIENIKSENLLDIQFVQMKDSSLYDAMNQAILLTSGDYSLFLNAGDQLADYDIVRKIKEEVVKYPPVDFIYGDNIDETVDGKRIYKKARNMAYISHSLPASHQSIFYKTSMLKMYSYPQKYKVCGDYAITALMYFDGHQSYRKLNYPISIFSLGGMSQNQRTVLLKEAYEIQISVAKVTKCKALQFYFMSRFAHALLDYVPGIYAILRRIADR